MNAITPPTPENIADFLTSADNSFHEGLNGWPSLSADNAVLAVKVTPTDEDEGNAVDFRAVVAPVSEDGMSNGPLNIIGPPGDRVLLDLSDFSSLLDLSPEQADAAAAQLIAAASLAALGEAESRG